MYQVLWFRPAFCGQFFVPCTPLMQDLFPFSIVSSNQMYLNIIIWSADQHDIIFVFIVATQKNRQSISLKVMTLTIRNEFSPDIAIGFIGNTLGLI